MAAPSFISLKEDSVGLIATPFRVEIRIALLSGDDKGVDLVVADGFEDFFRFFKLNLDVADFQEAFAALLRFPLRRFLLFRDPSAQLCLG